MAAQLTHEATQGNIEMTLQPIANNIRKALDADIVILYLIVHGRFEEALDEWNRIAMSNAGSDNAKRKLPSAKCQTRTIVEAGEKLN